MENRILNIINNLTAFNKKAYKKKDMLKELLKIEKQMVRELPELSTEYSSPNIHNAVNYFKAMNDRLDNVCDAELEEFTKLTCDYNNRVAVEISGIEGEKRASKSLETIKRPCRLLKNVELKFEGHITEIDILAITNSGIFIIEVKNSTKDIIIDEKGNYHRISKNGDHIFDKNIGVQMNEKEYILRNVLKKAGYDNIAIQSLVVFTNSEINVVNNYPYIKECSLNTLPHIIEEYQGLEQYAIQKIFKLMDVIVKAQSKDLWPVRMNISAYKTAFATLLVKLQMAEEKKEAEAKRIFRRIASFLGSLVRKTVKAVCFITANI